VLGNLRLGHRKVADECSDRFFASDQHVQDLATVRPGNGIEDVCRLQGLSHATQYIPSSEYVNPGLGLTQKLTPSRVPLSAGTRAHRTTLVDGYLGS
jgi:hypothetical protein